MIRFNAFGVRFVLPLPLLLVPFLARHLGTPQAFPAIAAALGIHELAHVLAARLTGVEITEIHILPFGGSARMENPYGISSRQLALTAAAGPIANLLFAVTIAAMAQWQLLLPQTAASLVQSNLALALFNLIPALPLDGGRILYAMLHRPFGETTAQRIGSNCGRVLAIVLVSAAIYAGMHSGRWNLSFLLAAVFILASEEQESEALLRNRAERLQASLPRRNSRPARIYHMDENQSLQQALRLMRSWESTWFVLTRSHLPYAVIDSQSLLQQFFNGASADTPLREMPVYKLQCKNSTNR